MGFRPSLASWLSHRRRSTIAAPPTTGLQLGVQAEAAPESPARGREVRFGLVLYGGVSLAIYIYGVVYEFWRLVRASQGAEENAYSKLLDAAGASATVDIVSGASAGGINGILLAKALTTGANLRAVRGIWVDRADFTELLRPRSEQHPRSLLRTDLFEQVLADGLADMDASADGRALVRAFDLFIPSTRLRPWIREFPTDLRRTIETADYRKSFRLQQRERGYNPQARELGYDRADFDAAHNPTLAAVARATSAFPFAFEPRRIARADVAKELYRPDEPAETWFADGGILNNKPFTEAVEAIIGRAADLPVDRWLVSVEPDPEHFGQPLTDRPEVDEVVSKALFGIPRYQSIAADLERLGDHRARAQREGELLAELDARVAALPEGWFTAVDDAPIMGAYRAARRAQLFADLGFAIADAASLDEPRARVAAQALRAAFQDPEIAVEPPDVSFGRRRIYHLIKRASARLATADDPPSDDTRAQMQRLWAEFDRLGAAVWAALHRGAVAERLGELLGLDEVALAGRIAELAPELADRLVEEMPAAQDSEAEVLAACASLDAALPAATVANAPDLATAYAGYWLWDQFLLPVDPRLGVPARDRIRLARVSPRDAQYISVPAANKVAGDAVFHFGGFLKKEWRVNDILWGRLDAAEMIVRMVLASAGADQAEVEAQIRSVQREITADELPQAGDDYRNYLETKYKVGAETLADVSMQTRTNLVVGSADVTRNMARGLASDPGHRLAGIYRWVGTVIGWVLALVRWPALAIWGDDPAVRRAFSLVVLFVGAWTAATFALVVIGVIDASTTLWILIAAGLAIFVVWSVLLAVFRGREPPAPSVPAAAQH